ncbi:MAG: aldehyde reductase [Anaerolineales bacterium]|nr:aldehyde reductase [Anaerolineales bacterium]
MPITNSPILVTGASGFIAIHTIAQLLEKGYKVRGTVRSTKKEAEVRETVSRLVQKNYQLEIVSADIEQDAGWKEAMKDVEYVLHVASPFPLGEPNHEDELIKPAVEGTLRVLRFAHDANVKRVVQVSSNAAVSAGHAGENKTFTEADWSKVENKIGAYSKSKTLAERAAWDFINGAENKNKMEMVAINPPLVFGPVSNKNYNTSSEVIRTYMLGQVPGTARIKMACVDVRDVASAIISAMEIKEANGNRFLVSAGELWTYEIAKILYDEFSKRGYKIPTMQLPSFLVRLVALFDPKVRAVVNSLDWDYKISNEKAKQILKWNPHSPKESVLSMAESLVEQGIL